MRNFASFILITVLFTNIVYSQCPDGGVIFTSQEQVDSFAINYPDCTAIDGNLKIEESFITDLSALQNLKSISGTLSIYNNDKLTDLAGLENLSSIGKGVGINYNDVLTDLNALKNTNIIGEALFIRHNAALTTLDGLENISSSIRDLFISDNEALIDISSLKTLDTIRNTLFLINNDALIDLSAFEKITSIPELFNLSDNDAITDLSAFENLRFVGQLFIISNKSLKSLAGLKNLSTIDFRLLIKENNLKNFEGLENLTTIGGKFELSHNDSLTSLKGLDNLKTIGENFEIFDNDTLKSLVGLENLTSVRGDFSINSKKLMDVSSLKNLNYVGHNLHIYGTEITAIEAFNKLNYIGENLEIGDNKNLISLMGFNNLKYIGGGLKIDFNTKLIFCNSAFLCNYLPPRDIITINNNAEGCNSASEILANCKSGAKIISKLFYDVNKNKRKDDNEPNVSFGSVSINPDGINIIQNPTNGFGVFRVYDDTCTVTLNEASIKGWALTTDSKSQMVTLEDSTCVEVSFGISPNNVVSKMQTMIHAPNYICTDTIPFYLSTKNIGTTITEGIVWLKIDAAASLFDFFDQPDRTIAPNQYGWYFDNLAPGSYLSKQINLLVPDSPNTNSGSLLFYESFIEFKDQNGVHNSETFSQSAEVRCNFDANDKLVNPKRACDFILMDEDIIYTTRFQNQGEYAANKVVIIDEIDVNLDLTTFSLVNSSHIDSLQTSISDNGFIIFEFNNINLPNSASNMEDSQGYISYSIKAKTGLPENTIIKNSSTIYFGDTLTVITHTVENVLVSELDENACNCSGSQLITWCRDADNDGLGDPNKSIKSCIQPIGFVADCSDLSDLVGIEETTYNDLINIYPNPSTGAFKIDVGGVNFKKALLSLYNANGQLIVEPTALKHNQQWLDYPYLANGVYYLNVWLDGTVLQKKLVVVK